VCQQGFVDPVETLAGITTQTSGRRVNDSHGHAAGALVLKEFAITSVGLACWGGTGEGAEDILDRADRTLCRAKAAGRDTFEQTIF
jgi:GGDEF domain-containing protein